MSMWEVQEAARVITESIDKEAKVIFGAVEDARLKKGEIKVTVIASGFPSDLKIGIFAGLAEKAGEKKKPDQIMVNRAPIMPRPVVQSASAPPPVPEETESKENDEWDVPAFFRRKR